MATQTRPDRRKRIQELLEERDDEESAVNTAFLKQIGFHIGIWGATLFVLAPVIWMFLMSFNFTTFANLVDKGIVWYVTNMDLVAYQEMINKTPFVTWFKNSLIVSIASTSISIVICSLGAYSIGRLRFKGRSWVATFLLITQMFPFAVIIIPLFIIFRNLGLFNTLTGLIIAYIAFTLPFTTWMLRGFYENLPEQLEEAAMVDGSTRLGAIVRVIIPLSAPAIATTFIFGWILAWNEFLLALVLINNSELKTIPPGIGSWVGRYTANWDLIMAGAAAVTIPLLFLFIFMQRYFVQGLAEGAVKT